MYQGKKVAICFSGHLRDFNYCYESLKNNLLDPLTSKGFSIDSYAFFWDTKGDRQNNFQGEVNFESFREKLKPKSIEIGHFDRSKFNSSNSEQWRKHPGLMCSTTTPDSTSMWYCIYKTYKLVEESKVKYDLIFRVRPDIIYDTCLTFDNIDNALNNSVLIMPKYMAYRYKSYGHITLGIIDYFGFGNHNIMKRYMRTYENISKFLTDGKVIHTAEGFLYEQLGATKIERTNMQFSLKRIGYIEKMTENQ